MYSPYVTGILWNPSSFDDINVFQLGNSVWYGGLYRAVKGSAGDRSKKELIATLNQVSQQQTQPRNWDWHHIVEKQHIRTLLTRSSVEQEYQDRIPVILIHKPEHKFFSQNFNTSVFKELSGVAGAATGMQAAPSASEKQEMEERLDHLRRLYRDLYQGYPLLNRVAENIFNEKQREISSV